MKQRAPFVSRMDENVLRVCYFGTYRAAYSRNRVLIEGLRQNNVEVFECHVPLWHGVEDRVRTVSGGWWRPRFFCRIVRTYWRLLKAYAQASDYDVMVLGYPGQLDVYLARLLTWARHKPLVLDVFMSLYLIASERGLSTRYPLAAWLLYWLEKGACLLPDRLLLDTAEYVEWFRTVYGLNPARFCLVPTGADDRTFRPTDGDQCEQGLFRVLYYGTFIPNHGTEQIIEAARLLRHHSGICFELAGDGPTRARAMALVEEYGLTNVTFSGWIDRETLPRKIAGADVCLGVFGTTPQSMMTIQNKIYEALAMGKPLITGESPTVGAVFTDGEHLLLCRREDPESLADAILRLQADPELRARISTQGHACYTRGFATHVLGQQARAHLEAVIGRAE